jgi:phosphatidylglycerophosphatase A
MRKLILFAATGAGSGYAPLASGTVGSVVGIGLYLLLAPLPPLAYLAATGALTLAGFWLADRAEAIFGRKDDGRITIDEVAGMLVALALLPPGVETVVLAFLLFRLFDIVKPPPAYQLQAVPGGAGVMLDDLVAGLYANLVSQLVWRVWFPGGIG